MNDKQLSRNDVLEDAAKAVEGHNVFHGDQHGGYNAPSCDAEELAAAIRRLKLAAPLKMKNEN